MNYQDKDGFTALIYAAVNSHRDCIDVLLGAEADVNIRNNEGTTACLVAANGRYECLNWLIQAGANVNMTDKKGTTPLILAA